ncbi:hypothetical protein D3C75_368320 [compost metagenome]
MSINHPMITLYSRAIDNITNQEIEGLQIVNRNSNFNFGKINGISGGESPVIIEFDIWNNESNIFAGISVPSAADATNCRFTVWDDANCTSSVNVQDPQTYTPYVRARCISQEKNDFQPIAGVRYLPAEKIFGTVSSTPGLLSGQSGGDHIKIQTKIVIPQYHVPSFKNFVFEFSYDYI